MARPLCRQSAEGERVGGVVGDAEELADGRDVPLAVRAVEPLGDVEHEVGAGRAEPLGEGRVGLEADDFAEWWRAPLDGVDGAGLVPLGVEIGLLEVVAQHALRRWECRDVLVGIGDYGGGRVRPGDWCRCLWLEIEG